MQLAISGNVSTNKVLCDEIDDFLIANFSYSTLCLCFEKDSFVCFENRIITKSRDPLNYVFFKIEVLRKRDLFDFDFVLNFCLIL